jgi:flagellar motor component MotA
LRAREAVDAIQMGQMIGALNGMVDTLSNLERNRTLGLGLGLGLDQFH